MPTLERARKVRNGMQRKTGKHYRIWFDSQRQCYRVIPAYDSRSAWQLLEEEQ